MRVTLPVLAAAPCTSPETSRKRGGGCHLARVLAAVSVSMETAGPQERGSPLAAGPGEAPRPCGPAPADQGNGLRGDIPKYSFGVSCPLWNPHLPLQLPPKKPSSTWWGTPSSWDSWGSAGPHIQDPREAGPGQRVPTPSPGSWPVQGSSVKRVQGKVGGGRPSPHCCHHWPQGHLTLWEWPAWRLTRNG